MKGMRNKKKELQTPSTGRAREGQIFQLNWTKNEHTLSTFSVKQGRYHDRNE